MAGRAAKELQEVLPGPTKACAQLPSASDLSFHRALDRSLGRSLEHESSRVLALARSVLSYVAGNDDIVDDGIDGDLVLEGEYKAISDALERSLERADDALDRLSAASRAPAAITAAPAKKKEKLERSLWLADIDKPQERFVDYPKPPVLPEYGEPERFDEPLWTPAHVDEARLVKTVMRQQLPPRNTAFGEPYTAYAHPYDREIQQLAVPTRLLVPPAPLAEDEEVKMDERFEKTPYAWIDTEEKLGQMLDEIRQAGATGRPKDLAIDVEHHDKRTWSGLTSLVQLSTYDKDYVIDVLAPSVRANAHRLNEFTASPDWIKVLHGAHRDIIWLQRDLGIYIVGMFDTYYATRVLNLGQHSLASLLDAYTSFVADKKYQQADWRIRPLPAEMEHYARSDTHFLLHIFNSLLRAIHDSSDSTTELLREIWERSKETSAKAHSHAPYTSDPANNADLHALIDRLERELPSSFTDPSKRDSLVEKIKRLAYLRERWARGDDDSPAFVMPYKAIRGLFESLSSGEIAAVSDITKALESKAKSSGIEAMLQPGRPEEILTALQAEPSLPLPGASDTFTSIPRAASSTTISPFDAADSTTELFKNLRAPSSSLFRSSLSAASSNAKKGKEVVDKVHETLLLGSKALSNHVSGITAGPAATGDPEVTESILRTDHTFTAPASASTSTSTAAVNSFSSSSTTTGPMKAKATATATATVTKEAAVEPESDTIIVSQVSGGSKHKKGKKKRALPDAVVDTNQDSSGNDSGSAKRVKVDSDSVPSANGSTNELTNESTNELTSGSTNGTKKSKKEKGKRKAKVEAVPYDPNAQPSILDAKRPMTVPAAKQPKTTASKKGVQNESKDGNGNEAKFQRVRVPNFEKKGSRSKTFSK